MLVQGQNFEYCADGCKRFIHFENCDVDGYDSFQPDGFKCCCCDRWTANECGNRADQMCDACKAYGAAQEFLAVAERIQEAAFNMQFSTVLAEMKTAVAIERDLGRRARILQNRQLRPSTESCDPATCHECRTGAA